MNNWSFTGNVGADCETRFTNSGTSVTSFSVAVKSGFGEREATTWARCSMFGTRGESVAPYILKGQLVGVTGEMTAREWTDKDGMKRTSVEVRVNDLTLLGKKDSGAQNQNYAPQQQQRQSQAPQQNYQADTSGMGNMVDDIPFNAYFARNAYAI